MTKSEDSGPAGFGRRGLLAGGVGGLVVGGLVSGVSVATTRSVGGDSAGASGQDTVPFYRTAGGPLGQAGVQTPPPQYSVFMSYDLDIATGRELQVLLARWSAAIATLMQGKALSVIEPERANAQPLDSGEAKGLPAANLTVTLGLGPGIFDQRFDLASKRPKRFKNLPEFSSDATLDKDYVGGDVCLHACSDDPQVAYHAIRVLTRMARTQATTKWTIIGFGRASAQAGQDTPRNLFGFKDGTRNVKTDEQFKQWVWVDDDDVDWMQGGTYLVSRKIEMNLETWDADPIDDQNRIFGRHKDSGAPLTGHGEFDTPDFAAAGEDDGTAIAHRSHIALSAPENNDDVMILRRPYNYTDGLNERGLLDAGLHFLAYVNDPEHYVRLQQRLDFGDLMNEYVFYRGTGLFCLPPRPAEGRYIGQELFD